MKMLPGMMPILHSSGVSTPGQFGPISRDFDPHSARLTRIMSSTGMPSVMQMISGTSASIASRMASAANDPGTIGQRLLGVEGALGAGDALGDDLGVLVDEDGHGPSGLDAGVIDD